LSELVLRIRLGFIEDWKNLQANSVAIEVRMNLEQFEIFIKNFPLLEKQYYGMSKSMYTNTAIEEQEAKFLVAEQLIEALNSAMPREKK
jgi:hypothetical protein